MSGHGASSSSSSSSGSGKTTHRVGKKSFFFTCLDSVGFVFTDGKEKHHICNQPESIKMTLNSALLGDEGSIKQFMLGYERLIDDDDSFRKSMLRTYSGTEEKGHNLPSRPSLVRILLGVDVLQSQVLDILLEKLPEYADQREKVHGDISNDMARLIIQQIRWLDNVLDGKKLGAKLMEIIVICPPFIQKEIISAIPDIIDDSGHDMIVETLVTILNDMPELTVATLDTLANLTLKGETAASVVASVVDNLASTQFEDLPVVIRFILQTTPKKSIQNSVKDLRRNLNFFGNTRRGKGVKREASLLMDSIKSAVRFQKHVAVAFLKEITKLDKPVEHKVLDFWILVMIHSVSAHSRQAEMVLKKKLAAGQFSLTLVEKAIMQQNDVVRGMTQSLLSMAGNFVRSPSAKLYAAGGMLYRWMFSEITNPQLRQEIVGQLITHIGSGVSHEIDISTQQLQWLSKSDPKAVQPYMAFVRGILDFLGGFSNIQIRQVFRVFSILAVRTKSNFGSELRIFVRKQLTSPTHQHIGVIGTISLLVELAPAGVQKLPKEQEQEISTLLESMFKNISSNSEIQVLLADEFSSLIEAGELSDFVIDQVLNFIAETFEGTFLMDIESESSQHVETNSFPWVGLNGDQGSMAVSILPILQNKSRLIREKILFLPSIFRLLQICEGQMNEGSRSGVDALLGAPLLMFDKKMDDLSDLETKEQDLYCSAVFHAIQWIRELLNAFADQPGEEMKIKSCQRVEDIISLEKQLASFLYQLGGRADVFVPNGIVVESKSSAGDSLFAVKKKKMRKKSSLSLKVVKPLHLQKYYRSLMVSSFHVLKLRMPLKTSETDRKESGENITAVLKPGVFKYLTGELKVLLKEAFFKVSVSCFAAKPGKERGAGDQKLKTARHDPKNIVRGLLSVLPAIRDHSKAVAKYLSIPEDLEGTKTESLLQEAILEISQCISSILQNKAALGEDLFWKSLSILAGREEEGMRKRSKNSDLSPNGLSSEPISSEESMLVCKDLFELLESIFLAMNTFERKIEMIDIMKQVIARSPKRYDFLRNQLSKTGRSLLVTRWSSDTKLNASTLCKALKTYIQFADVPLATIEELISCMTDVPSKSRKRKKSGHKKGKKLQKSEKDKENDAGQPEESKEDDAEDKIEEMMKNENIDLKTPFHATLLQNTFRFYFAVTIDELSKSASSVSVKQGAENAVSLLLRHASAFKDMTNLCKQNHTKSYLLSSTLKSGKSVVEAYVKYMPFFQSQFTTFRPSIIQMIKNVQIGTRTMQMICAHGKKTRSTTLISVIPAAKKLMESFIYQIKKMFKSTHNRGAFWQGNLKQRAMDGTPISQSQSQSQQLSNGDSTDSEGEYGDEVNEDDQAVLDMLVDDVA